MGDEDWTEQAYKRQLRYFETLGSRAHDEINKSDIYHLKRKVGFATCGNPDEDPTQDNLYTGYSKDKLSLIKTICNKIIEKSDCDPIHFNCLFLILLCKGIVCETPVFKIGTNNGILFIDSHARVYHTWDQFKEENKLPDCKYCFPINGHYHIGKNGILALDFAFSPASNLTSKAVDGLDTIGTVASIGAAGVAATSVFVAVAPAALAVAGTAAACSGAYNISRSVYSLVDRQKHEQSVGIDDPESRSAWMSIVTSAVGMGTAQVVSKAQKAVESGKSLSKVTLYGLNTLNATSLLLSGFGFVDTFINCYDKYNKGVLTKKDVFDLSCELLFLFNAVVSVKATNELINNMNVAVSENPSLPKKLTKTQKRNLRKRNAKRRAKGLATTNPNEVNDKKEQSVSNLEKLSPIVMNLIQLAAREIAPRDMEILDNIYSLGHDIVSWRNNEIDETQFFSNIWKTLCNLREKYKEEESQALAIVVDYFSFIIDEVKYFIRSLFENATDEEQKDFGIKIINMEEEIETVINDAERCIIELEEEHFGGNKESRIEADHEIIDEDNLNNDKSELNRESKDVFKVSAKLIKNSAFSCSNLKDFGDIVEGVKFVIIEDFKNEMSNYYNLVEVTKKVSGESFDLNKLKSELKIEGDVAQHIFKLTMEKAENASFLFKMKTKFEAIKNENVKGVPLWKELNDGMFHYFGAPGKGYLSKAELLKLINDLLKVRLAKEKDMELKSELTEENCNVLEDRNIIMVGVKVNELDHIAIKACDIAIYKDLTIHNTASLMVFIYVQRLPVQSMWSRLF